MYITCTYMYAYICILYVHVKKNNVHVRTVHMYTYEDLQSHLIFHITNNLCACVLKSVRN